MRRALVEVRQAEQNRRHDERPPAAETALQQVLYPSAKVGFFEDGDEGEDRDPRQQELAQRRQDSMPVQEAECEPQRDRDRRIEGELAQSDLEVAQPWAEVEADAGELANHKKSVESRVEQQQAIQRPNLRRPDRLEPV